MYIGFDIGGTNVKYGVLTENGAIIEQGKVATNHEKEGLLNELTQIVHLYQEKYPEIKGIGISAPGIIQADGFMTTGGAIMSLYGVNLQKEMETRTHLPVALENDANSAAIAEHWIGNAQGIDNYLCIVLGTGVGGGIIINGEVYRGAHGMAGEFGYMMINDIPKEGNIELSSLNQRAAAVFGLIRLYNEAAITRDPQAVEVTSGKVIFDRFEAGEELAKEVLTRYYQDTAVGLINLLGAFDPEVILIGGGISSNEQFMDALKAEVTKLEKRHGSISYLLGKAIGEVKPAKLRNDAGMIGAVYQIKQRIKR